MLLGTLLMEPNPALPCHSNSTIPSCLARLPGGEQTWLFCLTISAGGMDEVLSLSVSRIHRTLKPLLQLTVKMELPALCTRWNHSLLSPTALSHSPPSKSGAISNNSWTVLCDYKCICYPQFLICGGSFIKGDTLHVMLDRSSKTMMALLLYPLSPL